MSRKALVVGINQYPFLKNLTAGQSQHLKTPAADAEAISQLLETYGDFQVQRLPASNKDGKLQVDPSKVVTAAELEEAIADLFLPKSERTPHAALLFFTGHGLRKQLREHLTQGFLATSDASPRKSLWGMALRDLWDILEASPVQQQIIWLDCCFSGELLNFRTTELGQQGSGRDRFLIAASRDYEVAYQQLDGKHGVLTGAILAGLNPDRVLEDDWITDRTLAVSVEQSLQTYSDLVKIPQSPLISYHGEVIKLVRGRAKPPSEEKYEEAIDVQFLLLFHEILNADFKRQIPVVKEVIQKHRTAAFLIHGEQYCGQQLLVTRLSRLKPKWNNIPYIKIDVGQRAVGGRIPSLWQQLTSWLGLPKDTQSGRIIERVRDRLSTQDVIFIFDRVNDMQPRVLARWLQEFWQPLVASVEEHCPSRTRDTHLLMFLVDNNGSVCQSDILLAQKYNEPQYPLMPLNLPPISPFTLEILDELIERVTTIPELQMSVELTAQILLEKTENGIPELVYEEICELCGHSWEGGLAKWLI